MMLRKYLSQFTITVIAFIPSLKAADLMQEEIKHVVVIILENRSFDNVLAWLYSDTDAPSYFIPPSTDPHYLGLSEETLLQYTNALNDISGQIVFSCAPIKGVPSVANGPYLNSPSTDPHETFQYVTNQIFGFDDGTQPTMSGFLQDFANQWNSGTWTTEKTDICSVMETYTEKELPVLYGLAKHYAISDLWFSSVPSQTNPNRAFAHCGTSDGQIVNGIAAISHFSSDTIWNRLTEESPETTWTIFWQSDVIPGIIKGPFTGTNTFSSMGRIPNLGAHYRKMDEFHNLARRGQLPDFSFIEPQWTLSANLAPKNFLIDIFPAARNLVEGLQGNDFHPPGDMRTAENLLANIYTSLIANPEAWQQTLLIVTFDEHGGLFDHIPPPSSIAPDNNFENGFKFDRYGVRVPAIFISPKISKSIVIRADNAAIPFDHTSLIATLLKWRNIDQTQWKMGNRVDAAPTFENVITLTSSREDPILNPDSIPLPNADTGNVVQMGDPFYLRDKNGNYLAKAQLFFESDARVGSSDDKVALALMGGPGMITHGSFILIQSQDPSLGSANMLGTSILHSDCIYAVNTHDSGQWWTIKSVDYPYVGAEIHYGDRVYLENHIYLDPFHFVPTRLTIDDSLFGEFLKTQTISGEGSQDHYWILEKIEDPEAANS